jgi:hypothetical protein
VAFELRINGQRVWSSERQVTRISMQSGRGEIGAAGISPTDGVVDIFIEEVSPGGPVRLDELDRARDEAIRDVDEGTQVGAPTYAPPLDANRLTQGTPSRDVPAGGPDVGEKPDFVQNRPETSPTGSTLKADGSVDVTPTNEVQPSADDSDEVRTGGEAIVGETPSETAAGDQGQGNVNAGGNNPGGNVPTFSSPGGPNQ